MASRLQEAVATALSSRLFACQPSPPRWPGYRHYVLRLEDILLRQVPVDRVTAALKQGAGGELRSKTRPPKVHAAHSSAALAANTFGAFLESPDSLFLEGIGGFTSVQLEAKLPTGAGRARANLDVLACSSQCAIGVEAKLREYLVPTRARFSDKYDSVIRDVADEPWGQLFSTLKSAPVTYRHVDAAQLIKHYLGLVQRYRSGSRVLVYAYWEPTNPTVDPAFARHRDEVSELCDRLSGSDTPLRQVRFSELFNFVSRNDREHADALCQRYEVQVQQ